MRDIDANRKKLEMQIGELSDLRSKLENVDLDLRREMSKRIEKLQDEAVRAKNKLADLSSSELPMSEAKEQAEAVLNTLEESYRSTIAYLSAPR